MPNIRGRGDPRHPQVPGPVDSTRTYNQPRTIYIQTNDDIWEEPRAAPPTNNLGKRCCIGPTKVLHNPTTAARRRGKNEMIFIFYIIQLIPYLEQSCKKPKVFFLSTTHHIYYHKHSFHIYILRLINLDLLLMIMIIFLQCLTRKTCTNCQTGGRVDQMTTLAPSLHTQLCQIIGKIVETLL